jgi:hypothetical protein
MTSRVGEGGEVESEDNGGGGKGTGSECEAEIFAPGSAVGFDGFD